MTDDGLFLAAILPWIGVFFIVVIGFIAALALMWTPTPRKTQPQVKGPTQRMMERM